MGRPHWRCPRLLAVWLLSLLLTVITVLLSNLLMAPGPLRDLVQNCAPNIGELITLVLLAPLLSHVTRRSGQSDDGKGTAN